MKAQNAQSCRLAVRSVDVICRFDNQTLACLDKSAPLKPADGNIEIEILVDRMSVEIFADGGAVYMPMGVNLADKPRTLGLLAEGGDIKIESLEVYTLNSIWQ